MKKLFIASLLVLLITSSSFASSGSKMSSRATAHFESNFPSAKNVSWITTDNYEKATFTSGDEKVEVYYDIYGELIGSFKVMAYDKLPKAALETLTTDYTFPDYQLIDCIEFKDADSLTSYFISYSINEERVVVQVAANGNVTVIQ